ncbi:MAG: dicarboxylate/amino acid:cation symporter [Acidobacteriota bacterium]
MESSQDSSQNSSPVKKAWYRKLHWQTLIAMVLGVAVGVIFGEAVVPYVGWIGGLFVRAIKMVIVPLVMTSIISGVASLGSASSVGRMFRKTLGYYALSSTLAILVGLVVVNAIQPGAGLDRDRATVQEVPDVSSGGIEGLLFSMVPENPVAAAANGDMLALILFSILFGVSIIALPDKPRDTLVNFFDAGFQAMMKLTGYVIIFLPLGVFGLLARAVGSAGLEVFQALGLYMLTVASGLTIHMFVVLPLLLFFLGGIKPHIHFRNMIEPLTTAFSTSSSGATLPVTLRTVERKVKVSNRVSSFVLPMGSTVNMDGTALYECAGVLFIAQAMGLQLGFTEQAIVVLTALLASIGAAAVPSAGLVIIFIVLDAVNLRGEEVNALVGMMLAVDRPLDMFRTSVNIFSDSCGAAIIAKSEGETEVDAVVVDD